MYTGKETEGTVIAAGDLALEDTASGGCDDTLAAGRVRARGTIPEEHGRSTEVRRYAYGSLIGVGGMGKVLAADDARLGRKVAVKRAHRGDGGLKRRFLREAKIQARLEHPAIVPVYDMDVDEHGQPFFTMKKLSGRTLCALLREPDEQPFSQHQLLQKFAELCLAVEYAHQNGVIHRDIKPANIMLGNYGEIYLLDWGIAKAVGNESGCDEVPGLVPVEGTTAAGTVLGTPAYMAPEQWNAGRDVDGRADVFALGAVLFEILTGAPLIGSVQGPRRSVDIGARLKELGMSLESELGELIRHATVGDLSARLPSARALHDRLVHYLEGAQDVRRRRELARGHAESAHVLAQGSDAVRHKAIAEAARALALDPDNQQAQDTLGVLFSKPVEHVPSVVHRENEQARFAHAQRGIRLASIAYLVTFFALPIIWLVEQQSLLSLLPLELALALAIGGAAIFGFGKRPNVRQYWIAIAGNAVYLALLSRIMGPIAVTPALAMMSVCLFVQHGLTSRWGVIIAMHVVALVAPFAAAELGVVAPTVELVVEGGSMVAHSHLFKLHGVETIYIMIASTVALIGLAGLISIRRRRDDLRDRARTSLERWQLRLLVPQGRR